MQVVAELADGCGKGTHARRVTANGACVLHRARSERILQLPGNGRPEFYDPACAVAWRPPRPASIPGALRAGPGDARDATAGRRAVRRDTPGERLRAYRRLAQAAATTSRIIQNDWPEYDLPQIADFDLLDTAYHIAKDMGVTTHVGNVLSADLFYSDLFDKNIKLGTMGVKAVEMEAAALYYLAAKHQVQALSLMTISDSLVLDEDTTAEEREKTFTDMMQVGLETLIAKA